MNLVCIMLTFKKRGWGGGGKQANKQTQKNAWKLKHFVYNKNKYLIYFSDSRFRKRESSRPSDLQTRRISRVANQ